MVRTVLLSDSGENRDGQPHSKGISKEGSLLDVAVEHVVVAKSGAWFTYNGEQLGQGRENAKAFLMEHTDIAQEIERLVRAVVAPEVEAEETSPNGEADIDAEELEAVKG